MIHVRYDEVALKRGRRVYFERVLKENLAFQTGLRPGQVERHRGRIALRLEEGDEPEAVLAGVRRTFGVASASVVHEVPAELAAIQAKGAELARVEAFAGKRTFKVEARRPDKSFPHTSYEIACAVGDACGDAVPALEVDVHEPEFTIDVEVRLEGTTVHSSRAAGPGGVPTGVAGKALCLLSGGIDSPVAAWFTLKRGLKVDYVYFHAFPYTGDKVLEKVLSLARTLGRWTPAPVRVFVPSTTGIQDRIAEAAPEPYRIVLLRRAMHRLARAVLRARGHKALVTGEALGQVASQTPENLLCVETAVPDVLVLRPLLGLDKQEIVARAQAIDTYETSILPYQDCCSLFAPRAPETAADPEACAALEAELDLGPLEAESLAGLAVYRSKYARPLERIEEGLADPRAAWRERADG